MAGRPRTWPSHDDAESMRIGMIWPKPLWKELQHLALEHDTSATALVLEAVEQFLESKRKEVQAEKKKKKA